MFELCLNVKNLNNKRKNRASNEKTNYSNKSVGRCSLNISDQSVVILCLFVLKKYSRQLLQES